MASYESDALEVRDAELTGVVDLRVVVYGSETFRGRPMDPPTVPLSGTTTVVQSVDLRGDPWQREHVLRQASLDLGWDHGGRDALLLLSDADEIPHPEAVQRAAGVPGPSLLPVDMREWWMDLRAPDEWQPPHQPLLGNYLDYDFAGGAQAARAAFSWPRVGPRGWHLSTLGDGALAAAKLAAFAHSEYDTPEHVDPFILERRRTAGRDVLSRFDLQRTDDLPGCAARFPHLLSGGA